MVDFKYSERLEGRNIRILTIHPDPDEATLRVSLIRVSLDQVGEYDALSYNWGNPARRRQIECNQSSLHVTESLYQALIHIRRNVSTRRIWADAVCINQTDQKEKTEQVRMMPDIYKLAKEVVIWLGLEQPADRTSYRIARQLRGALGDTVRDFSKVLQKLNEMTSYNLAEEALALIGDDEHWKGLWALMTRPWFSRVWIIQELLLAKSTRTFSGDFEMDIEVILNVGSLVDTFTFLMMHFYMVLDETAKLSKSIFAALGSLRVLMAQRYHGIEFSLVELLAISRFAAATDPRDRIFALVGVKPDVPLHLIDYSQERETIVIKFAAELLKSISDPSEVLSWSQTKEVTAEIPSWVPDWTANDNSVLPLARMVPTKDLEDYGKFDFSIENGNILVARGKKLDVIDVVVSNVPPSLDGSMTFVGPKLGDLKFSANILREVSQWAQEMLEVCHTDRQYPGGIDIDEATWKSFVLDGSIWTSPASSDYQDAFHAWLGLLREGPECYSEVVSCRETGSLPSEDLKRRLEIVESYRVKVAPVEKILMKVLMGHSFCRTKGGYLGWAPRNTKVGDKAISLGGCHVPFIIREAPVTKVGSTSAGNQSIHRLIGDAYLYGLTGDVAARRDDIPLEDICLG